MMMMAVMAVMIMTLMTCANDDEELDARTLMVRRMTTMIATQITRAVPPRPSIENAAVVAFAATASHTTRHTPGLVTA